MQKLAQQRSERLALVLALRDGKETTAHLAEGAGVDRRALTQNLQILRAARLVESDRARGGGGAMHGLTGRGRALVAAVDGLGDVR